MARKKKRKTARRLEKASPVHVQVLSVNNINSETGNEADKALSKLIKLRGG